MHRFNNFSIFLIIGIILVVLFFVVAALFKVVFMGLIVGLVVFLGYRLVRTFRKRY